MTDCANRYPSPPPPSSALQAPCPLSHLRYPTTNPTKPRPWVVPSHLRLPTCSPGPPPFLPSKHPACPSTPTPAPTALTPPPLARISTSPPQVSHRPTRQPHQHTTTRNIRPLTANRRTTAMDKSRYSARIAGGSASCGTAMLARNASAGSAAIACTCSAATFPPPACSRGCRWVVCREADRVRDAGSWVGGSNRFSWIFDDVGSFGNRFRKRFSITNQRIGVAYRIISLAWEKGAAFPGMGIETS